MKRFILALAATVTGLVLLLGFKTHPTATLGAPAAAVPSPGSSATSTPTSKPASTRDSRATPRHGAGQGHGAKATSTAAPTTRTITGGTADTPYGPVQLQITLTGRKITGVNPLQLPHDQQRSQQIASYAVPQLTREALAAQSAHIDMVSGATYTSEGYAASLQNALDQAGHR
ncbi:FMN-binding protein [Segeticoccus rhizosphaerae]|uniref:FMN-binding protein n=1 Tax=Segeticoccus rhizosphaerae TaxID=1104777 RepID=UPI0012655B71|nr:FMN-binding protein [Segeticoccus rhizosphaerae]